MKVVSVHTKLKNRTKPKILHRVISVTEQRTKHRRCKTGMLVNSSRRLCVLRLPRERRPRRPRATPPGGSVYCACHAKGGRGPSGGHARRNSSRRLCVLRLPRERSCACHAKGGRGPSGGHARRNSSRRLCVLAGERRPRPQRRPRAPQLLQEALCAAPATRKEAAAPAAPTRAATPPGGSVYCACHSVLHLPHDSQPRASGAHARRSSSRGLRSSSVSE